MTIASQLLVIQFILIISIFIFINSLAFILFGLVFPPSHSSVWACCRSYFPRFRSIGSGMLGRLLNLILLEAIKFHIYFWHLQWCPSNPSLLILSGFSAHIGLNPRGHSLSKLCDGYFHVELIHFNFWYFLIDQFNSHLCIVYKFLKVFFRLQERNKFLFGFGFLVVRDLFFYFLINLLNIFIFGLSIVVDFFSSNF